ncbi:MAG: ribokinase [Acidimicrobiia bacterium]
MPAITVVGSTNLDLVATTSRLPKPGETVIASDLGRYPGGKGANQALAARRAGSQVALIAAVGNDPVAQEALHVLQESGVDLSGLVVTSDPTGTALVTVDEKGENQIVVFPGANASLAPEHVRVSAADIVLCQLEIPMETVAAAASTEGLFCLNAAPASTVPDEIMDKVDLLIVNEVERDTLGESLRNLSALVVVTMGAAGAKAFRSGRLVAEAHPPPVVSVDTVGAGDAFCGALVTALAFERSVASALEWACAAGALATTRRGAQPSLPMAKEIDAAAGL